MQLIAQYCAITSQTISIPWKQLLLILFLLLLAAVLICNHASSNADVPASPLARWFRFDAISTVAQHLRGPAMPQRIYTLPTCCQHALSKHTQQCMCTNISFVDVN
jgi:hypothetical protein